MADARKSLAERGDLESAREALERFLLLQPTNAAEALHLDACCRRTGRAQRAANHLARVMSRSESEYAPKPGGSSRRFRLPEEDESFVLASYEISGSTARS